MIDDIIKRAGEYTNNKNTHDGRLKRNGYMAGATDQVDIDVVNAQNAHCALCKIHNKFATCNNCNEREYIRTKMEYI